MGWVYDSEMRSRDDLRRQARTVFPGQTTPLAASLHLLLDELSVLTE
jgi:hypothetical protein